LYVFDGQRSDVEHTLRGVRGAVSNWLLEHLVAVAQSRSLLEVGAVYSYWLAQHVMMLCTHDPK
jgi:hypothetical protein